MDLDYQNYSWLQWIGLFFIQYVGTIILSIMRLNYLTQPGVPFNTNYLSTLKFKKSLSLTLFGNIGFFILYLMFLPFKILFNFLIIFGWINWTLTEILYWYALFYSLLIKSIFVKKVDWKELPIYKY